MKQQVDDFAVGTWLSYIWDKLDEHFLVPIKCQGLITHSNGVDVEQTKYYVKILVGTYLCKVIAGHGWLASTPVGPLPTPMSSDPKYLAALDSAVPPEGAEAIAELARLMNVDYQKLMGEMILAMITCRLDVLFPTVKMSQHSATPAKEHYMAAKNILRYLCTTIDDGIYFWQRVPVHDLPVGQLPMPRMRPQDLFIHDINRFPPNVLYGCVDSDWVADTQHQRSVTGGRH